MSFLTMIQTACKRVGLTSPTNVIGSSDENIIRMIALANEEGLELSSRHRWQILTREATHTTVATESQGLMTAIAGSDFNYIHSDTIWDRSQNRPIHPVSDVEWQRMKSNNITGPYTSFRIRAGAMLFLPVPAAGQTVAFEWTSNNWCQSSIGVGQSAWADNSDLGVLSEDLMTSGIVWRWKQANGLDYAEDFSLYERLVNNAMSRDGAPKRLRFGGQIRVSNIPEGSWS